MPSFTPALSHSELNCKVSHLALAWVARNPNTSTVILGASKPEQVLDNLKALEVLPKLTPEVLEKIEEELTCPMFVRLNLPLLPHTDALYSVVMIRCMFPD